MYSRVRKCSLSAALLYKYNEAFNKGNWQASVGVLIFIPYTFNHHRVGKKWKGEKERE